MKKICSIILSLFFLIGTSNVFSINSYGLEEPYGEEELTPQEQELFQKLQEESELLYSKFNQFLESTKDLLPEEFEEYCCKYISDNSTLPVILDKEEFEKKSVGKMILYRGVTEESFADEFKKGNIYIGRNVDNVRGSGIYTTASEKCAGVFANSGLVIKMFLSGDKNVKVIEYLHLKCLMQLMFLNHRDEFDEPLGAREAAKVDAAFEEYVDEAIKDCETQGELDEAFEKLRQDSIYLELRKQAGESKRNLFEDKGYALFCNMGLLAKLLGYNVLHTDEFDKILGLNVEEYLVLDGGILTICK